MEEVKKKKVFVGMSGGVDSSLSAALLKEQGYDVTGVFIRVWSPDFLPCNWKKEREDAMKVAAELNIPFKTYDFQDEYKKDVVDYMIKEYKEGRTPNPDVMCNRYVKFGAFLKQAIKEGADFVATGHYTRKREVPNSKPVRPNHPGGFQIPNYQLLKGVDENKDQSYFLWTLNQKQLERILFPIGHLEKSVVRKEAERFNLHNAGKKDSQGICFLGKINTKEFLKHYIKSEKGDVLNEEGEVIGHHDGSEFLTLGQRHGFTILKKTPNDKPYYIVGKNVDKNTITVSNEILGESLQSNKKEVEIKKVNWISKPQLRCRTPQLGFGGVISKLLTYLDVRYLSCKKYQTRLRYRQNLRDCFIKIKDGKTIVVFDELQENVTSGQSLVLYDGDICLGGGVIV
jgi:tRNA-uridine 2-sulfurtransferase